jgi:hypothetical protein
LIFQEEDILATVIDERLIEIFGFIAILYFAVTRIIRHVNWNTSEEKSQDSEWQLPNQQYDTRIHNVLISDATISVRVITYETMISSVTIFHIFQFACDTAPESFDSHHMRLFNNSEWNVLKSLESFLSLSRKARSAFDISC